MILRALFRTLRKLPRQAASVCLVAFVMATVGAAHAQVAVTPAITTAAGISTFDYTIDNATANDLAIVSISVPAIPGAVFDLTTPAGFLASFDSGTGFVDFLADTSSFTAGSSLSGFKFSSAFKPGPSTFSALDVLGSSFSGPTTSAAVPEPTSAVWLSLLALSGLSHLFARRLGRARLGLVLEENAR